MAESNELPPSYSGRSKISYEFGGWYAGLMQSEDSIRRAASELDDALVAGDRDRVVACFSQDCTVELLGVRVRGRDGVRRWHADRP